MRKWYVEEVYTPDTPKEDRARKYAEFSTAAPTSVRGLAAMAMQSLGWRTENAERKLKETADLDGTTIIGGCFDFEILGDSGVYAYRVGQTPFTKPAAWVVMILASGKPVAVRSVEPKDIDLTEIATVNGLPDGALMVVKVLDIA